MFPWWWIFVWAPRWPGSGDVSYGDWTNSLFSVKEAAALVNTYRIAAFAMEQFPVEVSAALGNKLPPKQLMDDLSIVEELINRSNTR